MSITKKPFGVTPYGYPATLYTITNSTGAGVDVCDFGGILAAIRVPDKNGVLGDVLLGYPSVEGYTPLNGYIGALIGRVGNRIADGKCDLEGTPLTLAKNEKGITHLHGGNVGFDRKMWSVQPVEGICEDSLILRYVSLDGEEGYPGTLKVQVTYTFTDLNELFIHYEAVSDKDTLCSLTNHSYFNLEGEASGSTVDHIFEINADTMTAVDENAIPTGEVRDVTGTLFDLRDPKSLREIYEKMADEPMLAMASGFDHNFNVNDTDAGLRFAVGVTAPVSGRVMNVYTDMPAVQFYDGTMLKGINPSKSGRMYAQYDGFCLETQYAPDSVNHPNFPDTILRAGEKYDYTTIFSFDTVGDDEDEE